MLIARRPQTNEPLDEMLRCLTRAHKAACVCVPYGVCGTLFAVINVFANKTACKQIDLSQLERS